MQMVSNTDFIPPSSPLALFAEWFALAQAQEPSDPNAMGLATADASGAPSLRVVLMKGYDETGFTFFTNRESHKGEDLAANARAALCFHWKSLQRQVRIEGPVTLVSDAESDAYFATRPRGSQIGAWASMQSRSLASRANLEQRAAAIEAKYAGKEVPRPPHWGGYRVAPLVMEFWQARDFRLHDRFQYRRDNAQALWTQERLAP
ncbi:MAG: pyridoxamine 5'-phosphate oxidase [Alphaproteobacteria bacterium]|nr:pyridoxamine 5'-phosphate oxidase [Alphaproteobacteria bacterium]